MNYQLWFPNRPSIGFCQDGIICTPHDILLHFLNSKFHSTVRYVVHRFQYSSNGPLLQYEINGSLPLFAFTLHIKPHQTETRFLRPPLLIWFSSAASVGYFLLRKWVAAFPIWAAGKWWVTGDFSNFRPHHQYIYYFTLNTSQLHHFTLRWHSLDNSPRLPTNDMEPTEIYAEKTLTSLHLHLLIQPYTPEFTEASSKSHINQRYWSPRGSHTHSNRNQTIHSSNALLYTKLPYFLE